MSARRWQSVTRALYESFGVTNDLRPFFMNCADHLGMWDRIFQNLHTPSREHIFDLFVDVSRELYPNGPIERAIWERAGGDPSRLILSGSGQVQWRSAIRDIRYGANLRIKDLIEEMLQDFPMNSQLQYLLDVL